MTDIRTRDIRKLDGSLLLVFRELLRCRNATETARRLSLSQSAVSHALARLRDLFDDQLFVRRPHGLEPTRRALDLAPKVEELMQVASRTLGHADEFDPAESDRLFMLAAPEYVVAQIGARLTELLGAKAPGVSFACEYMPYEDAFQGLRRGEIDLAIGRYDTLSARGLAIETLYEDEYCVVARRRHPRFKGRITNRQYRAARHVFASSQSELTREETSRDYSEFAVAAFVPQWLTALALVAVTDNIATCPRGLAERQAHVLDLQVLKGPIEFRRFPVSVARRADDNDPGIIWFMDQVGQAVAS